MGEDGVAPIQCPTCALESSGRFCPGCGAALASSTTETPVQLPRPSSSLDVRPPLLRGVGGASTLLQRAVRKLGSSTGVVIGGGLLLLGTLVVAALVSQSGPSKQAGLVGRSPETVAPVEEDPCVEEGLIWSLEIIDGSISGTDAGNELRAQADQTLDRRAANAVGYGVNAGLDFMLRRNAYGYDFGSLAEMPDEYRAEVIQEVRDTVQQWCDR